MLWFNKILASVLPHVPKRIVWIVSQRYIAGTTLEDAERAARQLNDDGYLVTIDLLGEFITTLEQAEANRREYLGIIEHMEAAGIRGNYSLKPTMFGLLIDEAECRKMVREVVAKAAGYGNFVRVDMEDSQCVDRELELFRALKEEFPRNVGLVVQSYLRRTAADLEGLMDLHGKDNPLNLRLCKGIYVEPPEIAYQKHDEINERFLEDLDFLMERGVYVGIATHDTTLIDGAQRIIGKYDVPKDGYEFQMLYGVTPGLRRSIRDAGHRLRVYVPFGEQWFAYSTRRLKENPNIASHIMKSLLVRG
jgi:proline dehydrogenase